MLGRLVPFAILVLFLRIPAAAADAPLVRPLPWLGFGADGGVEPEGAPRYLIAATGDSGNSCDPSRAAIGHTQVGKGWKRSHALWGGTVYPLAIQFVVHDPKTKLLWAWARQGRPGFAGWEWVVTALNQAGHRRLYGGWPDPAAHVCNDASTPWEFAQVCVLNDGGLSDDE